MIVPTDFDVDHEDTERALKCMRQKRRTWPLGNLPQGVEFVVVFELALVEGKFWNMVPGRSSLFAVKLTEL